MKKFAASHFINNPNLAAHLLAALFLGVPVWSVPARLAAAGTNEDFSAVSQSVVKLLQSRDPARFAADLSPAFQDWQSIASTNAVGQNSDPLAGFRESVGRDRQKIEQAAQQLLARAVSLHLDFSKGGLRAQFTPPKFLGQTRYPGIMAEHQTLPSTEKVEITLTLDLGANNPASGDFKIALHGLLNFPGGWRLLGGVEWVSFPPGLADAKTARELALLDKVASHEGVTGEDDPALLKLGDALVHFIRERDAGVFQKEAFPTADQAWALMQQSGRSGPTRQELDDELKLQAQEQVAVARSTVQQMEDAGIDLQNADIQIKAAAVKRMQPQGPPGSLVGLLGDQFQLTLMVKTDRKSKNGTPLTGEYVLAATEILRFPDDWRVMQNVHWQQLPAGVLDAQAASKMEFDNYVAEHHTLPPGTTVPEIEFTTLTGEKHMKLSDLRGQIVVLDFWATWCGPCQEPMAQLQTLRQTHPGWQDRVAIVPLSIDDTLSLPRTHVNQRGWTNTFNVWAGDGGWHSQPATAFKVRGVPTTYIIDARGQIIRAGHPASMDIGNIVDGLLGQGSQLPHAPQ